MNKPTKREIISYIVLLLSLVLNIYLVDRVTEINKEHTETTGKLRDRIVDIIVRDKYEAEKLQHQSDSLMREIASRDASIAGLYQKLNQSKKQYQNEIIRISNLDPSSINLEYYREILNSDSLDRSGFYHRAILPTTGVVPEGEKTSRGSGGRGCHIEHY
jgi:hypothetical protein